MQIKAVSPKFPLQKFISSLETHKGLQVKKIQNSTPTSHSGEKAQVID